VEEQNTILREKTPGGVKEGEKSVAWVTNIFSKKLQQENNRLVELRRRIASFEGEKVVQTI